MILITFTSVLLALVGFSIQQKKAERKTLGYIGLCFLMLLVELTDYNIHF
jgi:hypothetical protein